MKTFPKKHYKNLDNAFTEAVESMQPEEIKRKILESEQALYDIEDVVAADEDLAKAKEAVKEMSADYKSDIARETAKIKYLLFVMENRGANLSK
jgi:DNA-binding transcriptional regulator GbsR (MarR family)